MAWTRLDGSPFTGFGLRPLRKRWIRFKHRRGQRIWLRQLEAKTPSHTTRERGLEPFRRFSRLALRRGTVCPWPPVAGRNLVFRLLIQNLQGAWDGGGRGVRLERCSGPGFCSGKPFRTPAGRVSELRCRHARLAAATLVHCSLFLPK